MANLERVRAQKSAYRANNKEVVRSACEAWRRANPDKVNAHTARRRATKIQATQKWANTFFIEEAYHLAKLRTEVLGFPWHVDHIVPLRSKPVCGLHNEFNIQVIPGVDNLKKNNRYWPDMP